MIVGTRSTNAAPTERGGAGGGRRGGGGWGGWKGRGGGGGGAGTRHQGSPQRQMRVRKKICLGHGIEEWLLARSPKKDRGVGKKTEGGAKKERGVHKGRAAPRAAQGVGKKTLGVRKKGSPPPGKSLQSILVVATGSHDNNSAASGVLCP